MAENLAEKRELRRNMRAVVKFYCLRNKTATKTFKKIKEVYGDDCLSRMQGFALHKEFNEGRETAELHNREHTGRPQTVSSDINVNTRALVDEDHSL